MKTVTIKTAQNVQITFELAQLGQRLLAYTIDLLLIFLYYILVTSILNNIFYTGMNLYNNEVAPSYYVVSFILFLPAFFYSPLLEYITKGQTLGKKLLGIRVMKINGDNASLNDYVARWLFKGLSFFILPVEVIVILVSTRSQRIADIMANTVVVRLNPTYDYQLKHVLKLHTEQKEIEYPQIAQFTDEDMMFIKKVIHRVEEFNNEASRNLAIDLCTKLANQLGLEEVPKKKMLFLKTVLKDYVIITR